MKHQKTRINSDIRSDTVLLIEENGASLGIIPIEQALSIARDRQLDLVEVAKNANPPVCKVLDFGKYKYELNKRQKTINKNKKKQTQKEIRMQPKISDHDLNFKVRHIDQFLNEGNKVKVAIRFRGRELAYTQIGNGILNQIREMLTCTFVTDKEPSMEGNFMTMLLSPSSKSGNKQATQSTDSNT